MMAISTSACKRAGYCTRAHAVVAPALTEHNENREGDKQQPQQRCLRSLRVLNQRLGAKCTQHLTMSH